MTRGRLVLLGLMVWALLMIVPDLARVVRPLSSLGFYADSNGLIYDVSGPFADEQQSPAWQAGIRKGDRLDLGKMRCIPYEQVACASTLASVGGNLYTVPGATATLALAATPDQPARVVNLTARPRETNWLVRFILLLDQIAGIAAVLAAAWLVWTRPGPMSWGFFLYVIWFNPGQGFEFYAQLQRWPLLLIVQNFLGCLSQAAGYAGLLLFVMRAPADVPQPEWARAERMLPALTVVIAIVLSAAYGCLFGFKSELATRITILLGLIISACAVAILILRRKTLSPKDNQRLRWVMWGCLIGLPAFVLAELSEYTTLLVPFWGSLDIPDDVVGLLYLVNGILCLFVFEAVRRPRVVSVAIPLKRVTLLALTLSVPAVFLHHEAENLQEFLRIPSWGWVLFGTAVVFLISRLHEGAVEIADSFFNRSLDHAELKLGEAILNANDAADIDRLLSEGALEALKLSSAATFRRNEGGFRRYRDAQGWDGTATRELVLREPDLAAVMKSGFCKLGEAAAKTAGFPLGLETPLLAVAAANRVRCYAISVYGPHEAGTDIDSNERRMLENLGRQAADCYALLENDELRRTIAALQSQRPADIIGAT